MNYFNRIPIPITYSSDEKVKEVYIRTYPDNEKHLLQDNYSIDKKKNEKCTLLWFNPGKCLYQFIINNTKHLNPKKPIEKINNDFFNVLLITKDSTGLEIKGNSMELISNFKPLFGNISSNVNCNEKDKSSSNDECNLLTFSVRGENPIQEINEKGTVIQIISPYKNNNNHHQQHNHNKESNFIDLHMNHQQETRVLDKVLVYKYNNENLIEMYMTPYESDTPDLICLKYDDSPNADTIVINKNEVFYQTVKRFDKSIDISKLKTINELAIIKTIYTSFLNKKNYITANNVMLIFYPSNENKELKIPSSYMINAFVSISDNSLIIIKGKETEELIAILKKANGSITDLLLNNIFALSKLMKESTLLHISIKDNSNNSNRHIQFNLLPIIDSHDTSLYYNRNILLNKDQHQTKLAKISSEASIEIHKIHFEEEDRELILEFCNYNGRIINIIYNIMSKSNMLHLFKDFFKGLLICYLVLVNYQTFNDNDSNDYFPEHYINESLLIYYSNIMTLTIMRTLFQYVSTQPNHDGNFSSGNIKKKNNSSFVSGNRAFLLIYSHNGWQNKESANLLNDLIYRRYTSSQPMNETNSELLSNNLLKYYNESVSGWKSKLSNYFLNEILSRYEEMFSSFNLFKSIQSQSQSPSQAQTQTQTQDQFRGQKLIKESKLKLIDILTVNIHKGFKLLQNSELTNSKLKQLIYISINSSVDKFLFSNIEQIKSFIHYNKLIQYANHGINKYFCYLPFKEFIKCFHPLLSDISASITLKSFNSKVKSFKNQITDFIIALHTFRKIEDKFEVNEQGVYFGFQTFEILITLIQNLKSDKAMLIQSHFKKHLIAQVVSKMRLSSIILQNKWRNYFYKSMTNTSSNINSNNLKDFIPLYIINKYKKKDAILLKYLLGIKKMHNSISRDNIKLKQKYTLFNCQQSTNFNFNFSNELSRRSNCDLNTKNLNSSSLSSVLSNSGKGNNNNSHIHTNSFFISSSSLHIVQNKVQKTNTNCNNYNNEDIDNQFRTELLKENSEIKALNEKIEESKRKYKNMIVLASEYEKKIDSLISLVNSKEEVREILRKNGIQFT